MSFLSNFNIISEKGNNINVKDKTDGELFTIVKISNLCENEQKTLVKKVNLRRNIIHPNVMTFYEYTIEDHSIYLKQEYCSFGVLSDFIQTECIDKHRYLHEEFLCRIMYQIAFALKTVECFMGHLDLNYIFLSNQYIIKLYNFYNSNDKEMKQKEIKMAQLGRIMFHLSSLKPFNKYSYIKNIESMQYSNEYKILLISMIKSNSEIKKHLNKILSHSTVLLNSTQWTESKCFLNDISHNSDAAKSECFGKLEKIRKMETMLCLKEEELNERERKLDNKEKKLYLLEHNLRDKIQQVELYLKRCQNRCRSHTSGSSKASTDSQSSSKSSQKISCPELDSTYVSCGASDFLPTSSKLQIEKIIKPQSFTRTMSERRITFKTSPLKENTFNKKPNKYKSMRHSKIIEGSGINLPWREEAETEYENDLQIQIIEKSEIIKSMGWTEENKKYAFDMLRLMNSEEQENTEIKHTYL